MFRSLSAVIPFVVLAVSAGGCVPGPQTGRVRSITLARSTGEQRRPIDTTTTFTTGDDEIHAVIELADAPLGTAVVAIWATVDVEGADSGTTIGRTSVEAGGERTTVDFSLRPERPLPSGRYRVDVYLDGTDTTGGAPAASASFTVTSTGPRVVSIAVTTDPRSDSSMRAIPSTARVLYARVRLADVEPGTEVAASWVHVAAHGEAEVDRAPIVLESGQDVVNFTLTLQRPLPVGHYRVDVYLGRSNRPQQSVEFDIDSAS